VPQLATSETAWIAAATSFSVCECAHREPHATVVFHVPNLRVHERRAMQARAERHIMVDIKHRSDIGRIGALHVHQDSREMVLELSQQYSRTPSIWRRPSTNCFASFISCAYTFSIRFRQASPGPPKEAATPTIFGVPNSSRHGILPDG